MTRTKITGLLQAAKHKVFTKSFVAASGLAILTATAIFLLPTGRQGQAEQDSPTARDDSERKIDELQQQVASLKQSLQATEQKSELNSAPASPATAAIPVQVATTKPIQCPACGGRGYKIKSYDLGPKPEPQWGNLRDPSVARRYLNYQVAKDLRGGAPLHNYSAVEEKCLRCGGTGEDRFANAPRR